MKTRFFLMALVMTIVWGCQKEGETQLDSEPTMKFSAEVIGSDGVTRSVNPLIEIVSMGTNLDETFTVFNLKEGARSWAEYGKVDQLDFYVHYPCLSEKVTAEETREIVAGTDYLFGTATALAGQQQVLIAFKHVTVPLQVKVLNTDGSTYQGNFRVSAKLKNKGVQNLKSGVITALNETNPVVLSESNNLQVVNVFPQVIVKGTEFTVELENGKSYTAKATETTTLKSGTGYVIVINANGTLHIVDGAIPL